MNRFADIDIELKQLPPVYGYHFQPLLPIEEALKPIESIIDQLPYYIKIAKKHCHFPSEHGLTKDESAAIYIYTMEWAKTALYRVLNQALRSEDRQALQIWFPFLKLFDTALEKLPTVKDVVWRGVPLDIGRNYRKNEKMTWWSVNSCSSSVDVIKKFLGKSAKSTLFLIEATNGKRIHEYTQFKSEDEIILPLGTQFRVKSHPLERPEGTFTVHLIEMADEEEGGAVASAMKKLQVQKSELHKQENSISFFQFNKITKWKQVGLTVAGGNGEGNQLNQLYSPHGIDVDAENRCIYIADFLNHRVIQWKFNAINGRVVAGGKEWGNRDDQLRLPTSVIVDRKTDSLLICDWGNKRIVRWPRQNGQCGQTIISNIHCWNLLMDHQQNIYVSDKHEVKRFEIGEMTNGRIVAGGNGKGNRLDQLADPHFIFVDKDLSVYVADYDNHCVTKWKNGAREGIVVAGGQGKGNRLTQLNGPTGLFVDHWENVYVCDSWNHRVMCWSKGSKEGRIVVGGNGQGDEANQLSRPSDLSFDVEGNLYVSECWNNRIQKFKVESS